MRDSWWRWGILQRQGNDQNCAVTRRPRISLTSWKYKLFRVLRKLLARKRVHDFGGGERTIAYNLNLSYGVYSRKISS